MYVMWTYKKKKKSSTTNLIVPLQHDLQPEPFLTAFVVTKKRLVLWRVHALVVLHILLENNQSMHKTTVMLTSCRCSSNFIMCETTPSSSLRVAQHTTLSQ